MSKAPNSLPGIKRPPPPDGWLCTYCGKWDLNDDVSGRASPEHVAYRGIDIGRCRGKMKPFTFLPMRPGR